MTLQRESGVALWRQIERAVEREIVEGVYTPGDRLPTEQEFAARFGVNRHTVRRAFSRLAERGLLRIEQGRGTFVQERVIDYRVSRRTRFTENVAKLSRVPRRSLLSADEVPADTATAAALGVRPGVRVMRLVTLGEADGQRISIATHHLPKARFKGIAEAFAETGSLTVALARFGVDDFHRKTTRVTARMPTGQDADALQQPRSRPVLVAESVNVDGQGGVVEYCVTRFNSDWVQLVFEP